MSQLRTDAHWWNLKDQARQRGCDRCEFCRVRPIYDLHHRTYERWKRELLSDVMAVCRRCHDAIHFGGNIRAAEGSLASKGDGGFEMTEHWVAYLKTV